MIDNLSLLLSHGLLMLAAILMLRRPDLDDEDGENGRGFLRPRDRNKPGA
jgi:hypothetical protein